MSQVLELKKDAAIKAYNKGTAAEKALLENLYGKETFNQKITDRVKSYEDACEVLGLNPTDVYSTFDAVDDIAYKKLKVIALALNEGWKPNWKNSSEYKYFTYFRMDTGFSFFNVRYACSFTDVGSRLCFRSEALAQHAAAIGFDLYKDYYVIPD